MIIEALLNLIHGLISTVTSFISDSIPDAPAFVSDIGPALTSVFELVPKPVLHFVPIVPVITAGAVALGLVVLFGAIKFTRRVISIFTGGGGNA